MATLLEDRRRTAVALVALVVVSGALLAAFDGEDGILGVVAVLGNVAAVLGLGALVVLGLVALNDTGVGCLGAFLIAAALMMVGGGIAAFLTRETADEREEAAIEALEPRAAAYARSTAPRSDADPHLRGRVVVVDVKERNVDKGTFIRLPEELQAREPKEVATIVQLRFGEEVVGTYEPSGGKAIQEHVDITIIDRVARRSYAGEQIEGPNPPYGKSGLDRGDERGGKPDDALIADYLEGLRRVPARAAG